MDDLIPEEFYGVVKFFAVAGMAMDGIEMKIVIVPGGDVGRGMRLVAELAFETPENAPEKEFVVEAHEVTLDVEFDGKGGFGIIIGGAADVGGEALLAVEGAFILAAGIGVGDKAAIPPIGADIEEEVVDDAVAKGGGDDFAGDGVVDDEGDAARRFITAANNTVAEEDEIFHIGEFEAVFVDGFAFAFAGVVVGLPEGLEEEFFEAGGVGSHYWGGVRGRLVF